MPESIGEGDNPLSRFRREIQEKIDQELRRKVESGHFISTQEGTPRQILNPNLLTEEDMRVYEILKTRLLTRDEIHAYGGSVLNALIEEKSKAERVGENVSIRETPRGIFREFILNQQTRLSVKKKIADRERKESGR